MSGGQISCEDQCWCSWILISYFAEVVQEFFFFLSWAIMLRKEMQFREAIANNSQREAVKIRFSVAQCYILGQARKLQVYPTAANEASPTIIVCGICSVLDQLECLLLCLLVCKNCACGEHSPCGTHVFLFYPSPITSCKVTRTIDINLSFYVRETQIGHNKTTFFHKSRPGSLTLF